MSIYLVCQGNMDCQVKIHSNFTVLRSHGLSGPALTYAASFISNINEELHLLYSYMNDYSDTLPLEKKKIPKTHLKVSKRIISRQIAKQRIRFIQCLVSGKTFSVHLFPPGEYVQRRVDIPCWRVFVPCFFSLACRRSRASMPGHPCLGLRPRSCKGVKWHSPIGVKQELLG